MSRQSEKQPFWENLTLPIPNSIISLEDYRILPETSIPMEHIHSRVVYPHWNEASMSPTPRPIHQLVVGEVYSVLRQVIPDGRVVLSPMDLRLGEDTVQPDIFWIAAESACTEQETYFQDAPDLIVEVLSPGNTQHDRVTKFDLYESYAVPEYWIIDPNEQFIEVYTLEDGRFARLRETSEEFVSPVLGRAIRVRALFDV